MQIDNGECRALQWRTKCKHKFVCKQGQSIAFTDDNDQYLKRGNKQKEVKKKCLQKNGRGREKRRGRQNREKFEIETLHFVWFNIGCYLHDAVISTVCDVIMSHKE